MRKLSLSGHITALILLALMYGGGLLLIGLTNAPNLLK